MAKVLIVFPSILMLWDFKIVFYKSVVQNFCFRRSLVCLCTQEQIDLAVQAYGAKVLHADGEEARQTLQRLSRFSILTVA